MMAGLIDRLIPKPLTGKHVFIGMAVFFGLVTLSNVVMIVVGLNTHPGVVTEDAYRKGRDYNDQIDQAAAQAALGWSAQTDIMVNERGLDGLALVVTAVISDRDGLPLHGLNVSATLVRPVTDGLDQDIVLSEGPDGHYEGPAVVAAPGRWRLEVSAADAQGRIARWRQDEVLR